ncbi:MAG: Do family serine endopeptidase [Saprospiraceae bacterium]|nr:Do family serine endopeptidase [Saprospiraceae bacterium]
MKKTLIFSGLIALVVSAITFLAFYSVQKDRKTVTIQHVDGTPAKSTLYSIDEDGKFAPLDFTEIAANVVGAVVHIKSSQTMRNRGQDPRSDQRRVPDPFREFFEPFFRSPDQRSGPQIRVGTGSGVILDKSGYIVTNNHVVANADDLEVTLHDNRSFKATVIGTDPTTDLAVIQINADNLPTTLPLVNSDDVKVGEWVLAVGNPLGLNSTVTAGIVSAKGRNINILREQYAVESFIQTDAAINPGNSGGALVNMSGGLIGINTAIASPTGTYAGYGFAVPSNIVNKVVEDLLQYGTVQRAVLGVMIRSVDGNLAKEKNLAVNSGAYIDSLLVGSAALAAGIEAGDVITEVEGKLIRTSPELQEIIAQFRPGDKVKLKVDRKGKVREFNVTLNNRQGNRDLVSKESKDVLGILGVDLEEVEERTAEKLEIDGGVKVIRLYAGKLEKRTEMREGFIITKIDDKIIRSVDEFVDVLENKSGGVMLEGVYEDIPGTYYYAFGMNS